jgi:hypothetical protein
MKSTEESIQSLQITKRKLHEAAEALSAEFNGAPVVVVVGGSSEHDTEATVAGWANLSAGRQSRFRDLVGILQSAIQLESFFHYMEDNLFQELKQKIEHRTWWSRSSDTSKP